MSSRSRTLAMALVFLTCGILIAVYVNRHGLIRRMRLGDLRETPSLLLDYANSEDPARSEAAELFLREEAGRETLFDFYLAEFSNSAMKWNIFRNLTRTDMQLAFGSVALGNPSSATRWQWGNDKGVNQGSFPIPPIDVKSRETVLRLLESIRGVTFVREQYPGFEFQLVPVGFGQRVGAIWPKAPKSKYKERPAFEWRGRSKDIQYALMIRAVSP